MSTFISMLRGINVSGQKRITMADLKSLYGSLHFANVETYVQSGNVVFDSSGQNAAALAYSIETQIEKTFGFAVPVFIRDADDLQRIIDSNPFLNERPEDPAKLHVTFLYRSPSAAGLGNLVIPPGETAEFAAGDREIFLFCPNGYGRTKLSNSFFERRLDMPATTRNWKTVLALYDMATGR
jgi:uncharacterized protein (DUF1697 family)